MYSNVDKINSRKCNENMQHFESTSVVQFETHKYETVPDGSTQVNHTCCAVAGKLQVTESSVPEVDRVHAAAKHGGRVA